MKSDYIVAGHRFTLSVPDGAAANLDLRQYAPFLANSQGDPVFTLEIVPIVECDGAELVFNQPTEPGETCLSLWKRGSEWLFKMAPTSSHPTSGVFSLSSDYTRGRLQILRPEDASFALNNSAMLQYAFRTASLGTLEVHASVVVNDGKGYLFMAKSGTGKSTHSLMWHRAIPGTRLLNDDNPIVRALPDGQVVVYGSPWSGKTPCYRNEQYSVGAFVRIVRADHNRLVPLSVFETYALLYSSSSGFKAQKSLGDALHETISECVTAVPGYNMECLPNEDAARVCYEGLMEGRK